MIRGEYRPRTHERRDDDLCRIRDDGSLTMEELIRRYCTLVCARTGSYVETARRLGLDRRTVKVRVDPGLLARLHGTSDGRAGGDGMPRSDPST